LVLRHLPVSADQHDKVLLTQWLDQESLSRFAFAPVRLFAGWLVFSLALFYACRSAAYGEPFRFAQLFSLEVHAESALLLAKLATLLRAGLSSPSPDSYLVTPFSVAVFVDPGSFPMAAFLNSLNVFTMLYLGIIAVGVSVICNMRTARSIVIVFTVWGVSEFVNSGILAGLQTDLHLIP